mmetsp:Transcript_15894/g.53436  ORF Transcript_15894/g.53436 Transcript_15894/m.53436 type:complete len:216 (-) Transcript_15894:17-664(-)
MDRGVLTSAKATRPSVRGKCRFKAARHTSLHRALSASYAATALRGARGGAWRARGRSSLWKASNQAQGASTSIWQVHLSGRLSCHARSFSEGNVSISGTPSPRPAPPGPAPPGPAPSGPAPRGSSRNARTPAVRQWPWAGPAGCTQRLQQEMPRASGFPSRATLHMTKPSDWRRRSAGRPGPATRSAAAGSSNDSGARGGVVGRGLGWWRAVPQA